MARKKSNDSGKRPIESYDHKDKERLNNPPVGLVSPETDKDLEKKKYSYDPHLDPQLVWAGKAEHKSFEVPTVSLHVHERIDPKTVMDAVRKQNGGFQQGSLFETPEENPPLRNAIEFYKHSHNWSNRLIAGDSLLVMNSLLEKEGMAGKVQMIYIDPPYGIKYGSNFQPFLNQKEVRDGKDDSLTAEPEQLQAFRDTWELGIHSYLSYLQDRLKLIKDILAQTGSIFFQIGDENIHLVKSLLDEMFGSKNLVSVISIKKTTSAGGGQSDGNAFQNVADFVLWYAKSKEEMKYRPLYMPKVLGEEGAQYYNWAYLPDGSKIRIRADEMMKYYAMPGAKLFRDGDMTSLSGVDKTRYEVEFEGRKFTPHPAVWKTSETGMIQLRIAGRLLAPGKNLRYVRFLDDFPVSALTNVWTDMSGGVSNKIYVVQTNIKAIARCLLMTTDPGDLVLDPTCGSGSTAYVAEQWGRRWITCDTSRVAITLAKQRLMTANYDFYQLSHLDEGVGSGFVYKTVPHITLRSIANNSEIKEGMTREQIDAAIKKHAPQETLYDQPVIDKKKIRVTGPFTVEAVPAPVVKALDDIHSEPNATSDASVARDGETLRQSEWRDELFKTGVRGKAGQRILFSRIEPLPTCRWIHADGETKEDTPQRVVISFGSAYAPLEQRQVELAIQEAQTLVPKPTIVIFAAFQFDPEASKDIDEIQWSGVSLLKAQMNADLLTEDLKKKRSSNESFWLIGQPDIKLSRIEKGDHKGKWIVEVLGFDYYNTISGKVESGGTEKIAMWLLDTDYDGRSLFPRQVFFPIADDSGGWARLAKNLKAEIDEELIEQYRGTVSLPFEPGENKRVAVKIIDDRGIESLKVMGINE
jgi:adenine-specific DNA-methyltransferase